MEFSRRNSVLFFLGVFGSAGTVYSLVYLRKMLRKSCKRPRIELLTDRISLETLGKLSEVSNVSIRHCARGVLIHRALEPECLRFVIQLCYAENEESILKACTVIEYLSKNPKCRAMVIYFGGLEALSHAIYRSWAKRNKVNTCDDDVKIQHLACMTIFDLISVRNDDSIKIRLLDKNPSFLPTMLGILKGTSDKEIEKWGFFIIHQIADCESTRNKLSQHWVVIEVVSKLLVNSQGELLRLRIAFQVLVTLANILMANDEENVLQEIRSHGVIMPMIGSLKSENRELVYWAVGLLHEFVALDVAVPDICSVPILLRSLCSVLISSEASIQRLVLRVLRFLCESSEDFKIKTIHNKQLLARLPICLASGDHDVTSWSLYLIHDIVKSGVEAIELLFEHAKGVVEALVEMCGRNVFNQDANTMCRYIAETLGFFCSVETIQCEVVKAGALKAVLQISMMDDIDMKVWSTSLLLNLSMSSEELKEDIVKGGGVKVLIDLAVSDTDEAQIAIQAAKTLVMLGFLDSPFAVDLKSSNSLPCSVLVNGVEHSRNDLGINVVVVDPVTLNVEETESFDTGHFADASIKLSEYIQSLPLMAVVFVVVRGEGNFFLTEVAKETLASVGLIGYEYNTGELWVLSGQKRYGLESAGEIKFKHGYDNVELKVRIAQGSFVNDQVKVLIMEPLLDVLMSTSPESNISKVSELELLTIFARHDSHCIVMLEKEGFLDYVAKIIWNVASRSLDDLSSNPMLVAHCIGAMKTVAGLILSDTAPERCLQHGVLKEVLRLLFFINDTLLDLKNEGIEVKSNMKNSDLSFLTSTAPGVEEKAPFSSVCDSPSAQVCKQALDEGLKDDAKCNYEDFEEAFISLTQLAVTILYNSSKKLELADDSLYMSLFVNVLWCTLLACKEELRRAITIPIENMITHYASRRKSFIIYSERIPVCLNHKEKTKALMLSSDRTEVINFNWTFESVHANVAVGRRRCTSASARPDGWYYEAQVMTQGIMQIGWRTSKCEYSPEKGVGVGDDVHSCAFDGARMKVWNGPACRTTNNDYGAAWTVNDVVSCLFSWEGDVSFWLNGVDLGVAFTNVNPELDYYPAVSLAMDQHCSFNFGGDKPFRYCMPEGYIAVSDVLEKKSSLKRPRSKSYTKGSFESIAEVDEENVEDVKNIQIVRLQRCSSSEPSLHGNESNRASEAESSRRFSTSTTSCHPGAPSTPMSWASSTPSTPFTPVTPLSPFWSPASSRNTPDLFSGIPCVYFETEVKECGRRARNVGYYFQKTGENCSCEFYDGQTMSFPSELARTTDLVRAPSVIGCGLLWPDGVFFTLDGVYNNTVYPFSGVEFEEGECLPYITYPSVKVNYGQEEFLMERANAQGQRLSSAQLLHSFSRHLLDRLM